MVLGICQFTEILQRFHGALTMSIYRDFAEISWCPDYVNLQRFYGALTTSIYRDFIVPHIHDNMIRLIL